MTTALVARTHPARNRTSSNDSRLDSRYVRLADLDESTRARVAEYTVPRRGLDGELVVDLAELGEFGVLES